jgi:hypothetical protein
MKRREEEKKKEKKEEKKEERERGKRENVLQRHEPPQEVGKNVMKPPTLLATR